MKREKFLGILVTASLLFSLSCHKKEEVAKVYGCTDANSMNYNPSATVSSGCKYADKYIPMKQGNKWTLLDTIEITTPFPLTLPVIVSYEVGKDSVIHGKTYSNLTQSIMAFVSIPVGNFWLRQDSKTGKIFNYNAADSSETIYLDYPLEVGKTWADSTATYLVEGNDQVYIPVRNSSIAAWNITSTPVLTGTPTNTYYAKDIGIVRQKLTLNLGGTLNFEIDAHLDTLNLN